MAQKEEDSYTIIDFRQGVMELRPYVKKIRFVLPDTETERPFVLMKYSNSIAEKLFWIGTHLRQTHDQALIFMEQAGCNVIKGNCLMDIPAFPIVDFAKNFRILKILEREIKEMRVVVMAQFGLEVLNPIFYDRFCESACELRIECESPLLEMDPYTFPFILDAKVLNPTLAS